MMSATPMPLSPGTQAQLVEIERTFDSWRSAARSLLMHEITPGDIYWSSTGNSPMLTGLTARVDGVRPVVVAASDHLRVPKAFLQEARLAACFRDEARWSLLYRMLFRLTHGEAHLMHLETDDDVLLLRRMAKHVRRDRHKMHAFVRFRKVTDETEDHYVAWHRPDHFIVPLSAPFFRERFGDMRWTILTPDDSVRWDGVDLEFGPGVPVGNAPQSDELEVLWKTYYGNIFNPARIKLKAMRAEMPKKHWATLPETQIIPDLLRDAPNRVRAMMKTQAPRETAADYLPGSITLPQMARAIAGCRGCDLYECATQPVFGEGPATAGVMFIGEQPGDKEDLAGKPFVGPAGQLFDEMLREAGIERDAIYVTNAVKHFRFTLQGKRRIHAKPTSRQVASCRPWLEREIEVVQPRLIVAMGATAAQSLMGGAFRVTHSRGKVMQCRWAEMFMATYHPSALLRIPDATSKQAAMDTFRTDMRTVKSILASPENLAGSKAGQ